MDLAMLDTARRGSEGVWMEARHPGTGVLLGEEGKRPRLLLLGGDSRESREFQQKRTDLRLQDSMRRTLTSADVETDDVEAMVALTRNWENIELDGKPLPFSSDNARVVYRRFVWLREQAGRFVGDRSNFLPASSNA